MGGENLGKCTQSINDTKNKGNIRARNRKMWRDVEHLYSIRQERTELKSPRKCSKQDGRNSSHSTLTAFWPHAIGLHFL